MQRGYNAFIFEGPGQGEALYEQGLFFRREFEYVLTPAIDWLIQRPDVDPDNLILVGRSFAGYLAPRAATAEHRIAALVCDPAQPDLAARLPGGWASRLVGPIAALQMRVSRNRAEFFGARMAAHGISQVTDYIDEMRRYTMLDMASQITCPTLVIECEGDFVRRRRPSSGRCRLGSGHPDPTNCRQRRRRALRWCRAAGVGGRGLRLDQPSHFRGSDKTAAHPAVIDISDVSASDRGWHAPLLDTLGLWTLKPMSSVPSCSRAVRIRLRASTATAAVRRVQRTLSTWCALY